MEDAMTTPCKQNPAFPTSAEILAAARKHVAENCAGVWPEDDTWVEYLPAERGYATGWTLLLETDEETGEPLLTVYPTDSDGTPNMGIGIVVSVAADWPAEVAAIWARLCRDHADDAAEMAALLTTDDQRRAALEEFDEGMLDQMEEALFSAGIKTVSSDWYIDATSPGGEPDRFGPYDTPEETNKARERLASRDYHGFSVPYQWSGE
jgi:hypothetical protein